jgi:hypothetical protein
MTVTVHPLDATEVFLQVGDELFVGSHLTPSEEKLRRGCI